MQTIQILGLAGVASYATARLLVRYDWVQYARYAVIAVPVDTLPDMPKGYRVAPLDAGALSDLTIDAPADVQADRFAQGMTCLGAYNAKDVLVGVIWVAPHGIIETDVQLAFTIPSTCSWDTGLWIDPRYRLSRAFAALWAGAAMWMRDAGKRWSISRIADYNLASTLSHRRLGAVLIDHQLAITMFGWQYCGSSRPRLIRVGRDAPAPVPLGPRILRKVAG
jgi:hypothetical protein